MKNQPQSRLILSYYWRYTKRYLPAFLMASIGAILAVIFQGIIPPLIVAHIFKSLQTAYTNHQVIKLSHYLSSFIYFALAMLIGAGLWRLQSYMVWEFEIKIRRDMADDIFNHLQYLDQNFHSNSFSGSLVSQTNKFIGAGERLMDDFIWNIIPGITTVVMSILVLIFVAWPFAIVLFIIVILYLVIMYRRINLQLVYNQKVADLESQQTGALADALTNVSTIKAFAHEPYESKRFKKKSTELYKANKTLSLEVLKSEAISHFQTNTFQIVALIGGLLAVTSYNLSASLLYLLLSYTQNIANQIWQFTRLIRNINRSLGDASEMSAILELSPIVQDPSDPEPIHSSRGEIVFRDVKFAYPENPDDPLFDSFNLKIKPGEKVGLVGPSGGGKTTITKLLQRFMDIDSGEIVVDKQNIVNVKQADLRSKISYVAQEPMLFHRSLRENIAYGDQAASEQAIVAVAKMAHAHDFISKLNHGYDTLVGERGVKLSGGQRQRIAIARAMLKNAPILVFDEATSALDSESELLIQEALWTLMEGKTAIVIAHRLSTIQKMDRIIVLENGQLVEQGSHKDLLAVNGSYAKLWGHQSGGFLEE